MKVIFSADQDDDMIKTRFNSYLLPGNVSNKVSVNVGDVNKQ